MNHTKINLFFRNLAIFTLKWKWGVLLAFPVIGILSSLGLDNLNIEYSNDQMFLSSDSLMIKTKQFRNEFGNDIYVGVLVENEDLFSNSQLLKVRELSQTLLDSVPFVETVLALTELRYPESTSNGMQYHRVIPEHIPFSKDSLQKLKDNILEKHILFNRVLSKDGNSSWIGIKLKAFNSSDSIKNIDRPEVLIGKKVDQIISGSRFQSLNPKASGIPVINYKEKVYFDQESKRVILFALLIALVIITLVTRSLIGVITPFITATFSLVVVFGIAGWIGIDVAGLIISLPILLSLAIAIAYSIHIISFYHKTSNKSKSVKEAIIEAVSKVGWPMLFTSLTTFGALMSVVFIPIPAIREMGLISALCVLTVFLSTFLLMPILLSFKSINRKLRVERRSNSYNSFSKIVENQVVKLSKYPGIILSIFFIVGVLSIWGMTKIKASFDFEKSIGKSVPYVQEILNVASSELGSLYSYDIVLEFTDMEQLRINDLRNLELLTHDISQHELTKNVTSVLDLIKGANYVLHQYDNNYYKIPETEEELTFILWILKNSGSKELKNWMAVGGEKIRIFTELSSYSSSKLRENDQFIGTRVKELFPNAKFSMVGTIPQFAKVNEYVVRGQIISLLVAMIIISLLIFIVFGNIKAGLVGLIPNIVPAIMVGGIMGFFNIPLDMMTVTIIPIIIGLSVDDTIHLFIHFDYEFSKFGSYQLALKHSIRKVGTALLFTTLILSANFLVYTISDANIFVHTGLLSAIGIVSALLADLFLTPMLFRKFYVFGREKLE